MIALLVESYLVDIVCISRKMLTRIIHDIEAEHFFYSHQSVADIVYSHRHGSLTIAWDFRKGDIKGDRKLVFACLVDYQLGFHDRGTICRKFRQDEYCNEQTTYNCD
jgi:hypothetical protein